MKKDRDHTKSRKAKAKENLPPFVRLLFSGAKAVAVAFLAAFAFILIGCLPGYSFKDPAATAAPIAMTAFFLSFFVCGFTSSRIERGNPIVAGGISAIFYLIPIMIVSLLIKPDTSGGSALSPALASVIAILCSIVGAFFGNMRISGRRTTTRARRKK